MRSELVFATSKTRSNRYALCHQVFQGARKLHKTSSMMANSINDAFTFFARPEEVIVIEPAQAPTIPTSNLARTKARIAA